MSLLVLTNNTSSININPPEVITLEIGLTPAGARGLQGLQGLQGETGLTGAQGVKGDTGDKGDKGDRGDKGDIGLTGAKGDQGIQGERGEKGETGSTPPITSTYGQSNTEAVSQKLLTDAVGDIESLLISINGV